MIRIAAAALLLVSTSSVEAAPRRGFAARYDPGLMEQVARNRGMWARHMVASPYQRLGDWVRVCSVRACLDALVVDICAPRDCAGIRRRGIVVELSHEDAWRVCGTVSEPPRQCKVSVWR